MNRCLIIAILLGTLHALPAAAEASPRPNIILIMADDMGWSDIGCYGGEIETPNIDRLAREGMLFTQFYNNAKCTTTRASLLTGLYPRNGGRGQHELIGKNMLTLGEAMRHAGYATGMSGKWHNGMIEGTRPCDRGFDESYGLWDGACNFFNPKIRDPEFKGGRIRTFGHNDKFLEFGDFPTDYYTTDAFSDHAVETIRRHHASGKPFLHYIAHTAPHYPLHARPEDIAKYKGLYSMGWDALRQQRLARQRELGLVSDSWTVLERDPLAKPWSDARKIDEDWQQLRMEVYAAMIDRMDQGIGRVLDTLDELGIARNTLVLFLTDNGGCAETPGGTNPEQIPGPKEYYTHVGPGWATASNTPFRRYKQYCHEGGIATPLVARWPAAIREGSRSAQVGHIIDFLPTFLEISGASYPERHPEFGEETIPVEGLSLLPVFRGKERAAHDHLCWHWSGNRAVRRGDWKLSWDRHERKWELYDLAEDRTEANDLCAAKPDLTADLAAEWDRWAETTGVR